MGIEINAGAMLVEMRSGRVEFHRWIFSLHNRDFYCPADLRN